jgi:hypothetical protein
MSVNNLTPVAADGGAVERAEALAPLVSTARVCLVPPQLNLVRYAERSPWMQPV